MSELVSYLDHAATTPMRPEAVAAMLPYLTERFGNPSGSHSTARAARRALDDAREVVGDLAGADPGDVVWTSGGTESDNLAVTGAAAGPGTVVCSAVEHPAVFEPARAAGARVAAVGDDGVVDLGHLAALLDDGVRLVSVMTVNNETGVVQPLEAVAELVAAKAPGALVHTDAVQAVGWLDLAEATAAADLVSVSGHKFGGPKGIGALVVRPRARGRLTALVRGGPQERERRAGTQNVAGAVALAAAAAAADRDRPAAAARVRVLAHELATGLVAGCPEAFETVRGPNRVPGIVSVCFPRVEAEELLVLLDDAGVAASAGSACASGAIEPSRVLVAMGWSGVEARSCLRFSLGHATTAAEIASALRVVPKAVEQLRD